MERAADPRQQQRLQSFEEFWPYYLGEHSHPVNRMLHVAGTTCALATLAWGAATLNPLAVPAALVAGYGPAWVGHFFFEKNRPATFKYPLWSLRADFRMYKRFWTGELARDLTALGVA
jgi:hypothetical protein